MRTCSSCGEDYAYQVVSEEDLARSYDFSRQWEGVRLHCPHCGAVQRTSFGRLTLSNETHPGLPPGAQVRAILHEGADVAPFPARAGRG